MDLWKEDAVVYAAAEITIVKCDPYKELVWIGDSDGRLASFYGHQLQPYTSFVAHTGPIKDIQITDRYILSLGASGVTAHNRNGQLIDSSSQASGEALLLLDSNDFLVGLQRRIKRFVIEPKIKETGFFEIESIPNNLYLTRLSLATPNVAVGLSDGSVQVLEPQTFDPVLQGSIMCHNGELTDLDSRKNLLATCGLTRRRYGLVPDVFVSCFDTRAKKALAPLNVGNAASFVRLHPKAPNHVVVVSPNAQLTFLDSRDPAYILIKQAVVQSPVIGIDISPLGVAIVIAEKSFIHFWSNTQSKKVGSDRFKGLEVPNSMGGLQKMDEKSPLSSIGLPFHKTELFSTWDPLHIFETGMCTPDWDSIEDPYISQSYSKIKPNLNRNRRISSVSVPRFLSEQARLPDLSHNDAKAFIDLIQSDTSASSGKVPKLWRQMFVHYSKFGVDDFDFSFYNDTKYSSLEPLSASKHCNALLQLYRWCPSIYNTSLNTLAEYNWKDLKVTGELAIVLDMLKKSDGYHCRATNFMDTVQLSLTAVPLHKALLSHLLEEHETEIGSASPLVDQVSNLAINGDNVQTHLKSAISTLSAKPSTIFVMPQRETNEGLDSSVVEFGIDEGTHEGVIGKFTFQENSNSYQLNGYVAEIDHFGQNHSVAVIKIDGEWHLFNDFLVAKISENDALNFSPLWKRVRLLMYDNTLQNVKFDSLWKTRINTRLLKERMLISGNLQDKGRDEELLKDGESLPSIVALDAEFVLIRKEVAELHSDGSKSLIAPKKLDLARISVVREDESVLIDDRIESNNDIVDYLTAYSGVEPTDLDSQKSKYGLVHKRVATRRLWILLNLGTTFVGHALINDFRAINLYVPPKQIIDTINLYYDQHLNGFRKLSLKFLMWAVLDEKVQTGNHDSVQDAQSALRLYRRYSELIKADLFDDVLEEIAYKGQRCNYRVPTDLGMTPPPSNGGVYETQMTPTRV